MILRLKRKCFYCKEKHDRESMYKLNMNTKDGVHSVFLCESCTRTVLIDTNEYRERLEKRDE